MSPIQTIPALTGFLCGLSLFPVLSFWAFAGQRRKSLKEEQQRLKNTTFILSGKISDSHLVSHIRSLCHLQRQGVLHVNEGRRKGYLLFRDGEIIDGFYRNSYGIEGFREIMRLTDAEYYFESRQVLQPDLIRKPTELLLQEDYS